MNVKYLSFVLIVVGIITLVYTGFNYATTEKIVDIGNLHINREKNHFVEWSPVLGIILIAAGVITMFFSNKK